MNPILSAIKGQFGEPKEVFETTNDLEAARMIDTGKWAIISGAIQGDEVLWVLVRFR